MTPRTRPLLVLPLALAALFCAASSAGDRGVAPGPPRPPVPLWQNDWSRGAVFYEVFVRSFQDSDGDGRGDLDGLVSRLDYLNDGDPATDTDLGVDALWLMPVFTSPSYHGYDTTDYETINPDYGTNAGFQRLLAEAHRRGIRVVVDLVMNHTGVDHPWFVESASSPSSLKRDWYVWSPVNKGWNQPWGGSYPTWYAKNGAWYYALFWSGMPDLNYETPAVREAMKGIAARWLERGVDGFRLDATRYLVETGPGAGQQDTAPTHAFLKELSEHVRRVKPQATLVGENWADTSVIATYYGSAAAVPGGDELPMSFDFPLSDQVLAGVRTGNAAGIAAKLGEVARLYPKGATDAPFLTNHDQVRLATQLGNDQGRLRSAAAILLTLPGSPFLYYGEEVGLQNGTASGDEAKRTPMPWSADAGGGFTTGSPWYPFAPGRESANVASETGDAGSLLSRYRTLIRARKASPALVAGALEKLLTPTTGSSPLLAFTRAAGTERVLVVHNLSSGFVTGGPWDVGGSSAERIWTDVGVTDPSGFPSSVRVGIPPRGTGIFRIR